MVFGEADGFKPFTALMEDDGTAFPENIDIYPKDDLAALPYSSGTTGMPKGVMLTVLPTTYYLMCRYSGAVNGSSSIKCAVAKFLLHSFF